MSHFGNAARRKIARAWVVLTYLISIMPTFAASTDRPDAEAAEASLLYLESSDWSHRSQGQKVALAADFMRIFCVDPTMSARQLEECIDRQLAQGPIFEQAITCASELAGR